MTKRNSELVPSPLIREVTVYRKPGHPAPIDLRLDANEGSLPSPNVLDAVLEAGVSEVRTYPNPDALEATLAGRLGIAAERVLVTAGADDGIERAMRSVLAPGREIVIPSPTFEMVDRYARLNGATVREIPWLEGRFPVNAVLESVTERTRMIPVVTPNSPTGLVATGEDLRLLSAAAPGALLLVDLAYTDFADDDLTATALELPNAVVVRTFSKAWGLAGLRVGWAAGSTEVIGWMRAAGHPYAVSAPSLRIAATWLDSGEAEVRCFVERIRQERAALTAVLQRLGCDVLPSQANFILTEVPNGEWFRDGMAGMGIAVRIFPDSEVLADRVRITLPGDASQFERLTHAIETVLDPQALLFDVDDTLADVTQSYRRATVETARAFGVEITCDEITKAKARGNANNDWRLTKRMIANQGVEVTLEEVTEKFELLYQGTEEKPGLWTLETPLVDRGLIEFLAGRYKLGIVTGRPCRDAMTFLKAHGFSSLFATVITMDDGPVKPSPKPVQLAMQRLGIERAWMIGDTPDDIRAAREAGALPLGVVAPADAPDVARKAMGRAGAARVFDKLKELEEIVK
jgi:histidinol-phosphate aminotransferase